jgi:hypothetical protein
VLADVPGTKLYLLLEEAMHDGRRSASVRAEATRRLLPASLPPRIMPKPAHDRPRLRLQREIMQMQYFFYRLIFHLRQNFVFAIERRRWRTLLDGYEKSSSSCRTKTLLPGNNRRPGTCQSAMTPNNRT